MKHAGSLWLLCAQCFVLGLGLLFLHIISIDTGSSWKNWVPELQDGKIPRRVGGCGKLRSDMLLWQPVEPGPSLVTNRTQKADKEFSRERIPRIFKGDGSRAGLRSYLFLTYVVEGNSDYSQIVSIIFLSVRWNWFSESIYTRNIQGESRNE